MISRVNAVQMITPWNPGRFPGLSFYLYQVTRFLNNEFNIKALTVECHLSCSLRFGGKLPNSNGYKYLRLLSIPWSFFLDGRNNVPIVKTIIHEV